MKIIKYGEVFEGNSVVTIGMFDGVHKGHRLLISKTIELAKSMHSTPIVYTFFNHPVKEKKRDFLTILDEKLCLLDAAGIHTIYLAELDKKFMSMPAQDFFKQELVEHLNASGVVVGENFKFGFKRVGDAKALRMLGEKFGVNIEVLPALSIDGQQISSTKIHDYIVKGDVEKANNFLDYSFFLTGDVVQGKGRGRLLGFRTANLAYKNGSKVLPKTGVYVTVAELDKVLRPSVTNVGYNPTFENDSIVRVEIHFLNTTEDLYGKMVRLHFLKRIRDEKKFEKVEDLIAVMRDDVETAKRYFKNNKISAPPICLTEK
jgi:riboflavin kinase/FMN adenylyltransferase